LPEVEVMIGSQHPEDAARALNDIAHTQGRVIDAVLVPAWYWWIVSAAMVVIGAAADYRHPVATATAITIAAATVTALTLVMILGAYRRVRVRDAVLLGDRGALAIVGLVGLIVGFTLGLGFGLRALGSPAPATIATAVGGALLVITGPALMRYLRRIMRGNLAGL
jgi:hypothetical protein